MLLSLTQQFETIPDRLRQRHGQVRSWLSPDPRQR